MPETFSHAVQFRPIRHEELLFHMRHITVTQNTVARLFNQNYKIGADPFWQALTICANDSRPSSSILFSRFLKSSSKVCFGLHHLLFHLIFPLYRCCDLPFILYIYVACCCFPDLSSPVLIWAYSECFQMSYINILFILLISNS